MPDLIIILGILVLCIGAIAAFTWALNDRDFGAMLLSLVFMGAVAGCGKWLHYATGKREWTVTGVYLLEKVEACDGTYTQGYEVDDNMRNATGQWGKIFPEGTSVKVTEGEPRAGGMRFWVLPDVTYDIILPGEQE